MSAYPCLLFLIFLIFLAGGILLTSGCRVVAPPSRMAEAGIEVPTAWENLPGTTPLPDMDWLRGFSDTRLSALVKEAVENNPDLKAAAARVDQAWATARAAGALRGPFLDLNGNAARSKRNFIGFPIPGAGGDDVLSIRNDSFGVSLDMRWELDVWGRAAAGQSAALANVQAVRADEAGARLSLAAQVCKAWFALIEAREQMAQARRAAESSRQTAVLIRERFESGQGASGDGAQLRLALSEVAASEADVNLTESLADNAARQLSALLGRYPSTLASPEELPSPGAPPPAGIPSELLARRPDVVAAERRFAAQGMRQEEARRALYPQFTLTGSGGTSTDSLGEVLNSDFGVWQLAGGITQPLWRSGQILAEIEKRDAEEVEALALLQSTLLNAFREVESALAAEDILRRREQNLVNALRLAEEADQAAREDFAAGRGDILTVFNTEARLIAARRQLSSVRYSRLENRVNLFLALGGSPRA